MNSAEALLIRDEIRERLAMLGEYVSLCEQAVNLERQLLRTGDKMGMREISQIVAAEFQIPYAPMFGRSRPERITVPRQVAMMLCYEATNELDALQAVSNFFNRTPSTVHFAIRAIRNRMDTCQEFRLRVERIEAKIKAKKK